MAQDSEAKVISIQLVSEKKKISLLYQTIQLIIYS